MKKTLLTKLMLLLCALIAGSSSVWAIEKVYKTLTFCNAGTSTNKVSNYTTSWNETIGTAPNTFSWTIENFSNNNWGWTSGNPALYVIKCGRKQAGTPKVDVPSVATITTAAAIDQAITKVVVTLTAINNNDYNSIKLYVASNSTFTENLTTINVDPIPSSAGEMTITIPEAKRAENCFYKLEFDTKGSTSSNGHTAISKVDYYYNMVSSKTETTLAWSANTYSFYQGDAYTLPTLTPTPAAIANDVTYNSSKTAVASIAANGTVTINGVGQTTITASYAGDATYEAASDVSYTLNVLGTYNTMAGVQTGCAAYGTTALPAKVSLSNVYVTAVKGNNAYISDGTNGAVIYKSSHGFAAGDKLACSALEMTMLNYNGYTPEITSLAKTTDGLTVTSGNEITPTALAVNAITTANFGTLVKITNVTYDATNKVFKDASDNEIVYYDNFSASPTLIDGNEYDVTGVILIKSGTTVEICPRSAEDVKAIKTDPTSQWKNGEDDLTEITINKVEGTKKYTFETDSNGDITYSSSVETVATIASDGTITPVGYGTTIITANVASTTTYNADSKSFTLKVVDPGVDVIEIANITFASGSSYQYWTNVSGLTTAASYAGQSMPGQYIQIRNQSPAGIVTTASAGRVQKVSVKWAGSNTNNRYLTIYGKNSAYNKSDDLYGENKGDELGRITFKTGDSDGELEIPGNYGFIGIIASGAMYIGQLQIKWDDNVSIAIGESKFTTFSFSSAVDFSGTDVTAYTAKVVGNVVKLTPIDGNIVPAETGVILGADASGNYTGEITTGGSVDDNELVAVSSDEAIAYEAGEGKYNYILQKNATTDVFGFYKATGAKLKAGKAYLRTAYDVTAVGAPCLKLEIEGDMTGINDVRSKTADVRGEYFNLAGQRVAQPTKGLYIVNGKKVVVK